MNEMDGSLFFGGVNNKNYDTCNGKCRDSARPIDLWYIRTFVTILFGLVYFFSTRYKWIYVYYYMLYFNMFLLFPGLIYAFAVMNVSKAAVDEQKIDAQKK